MTHPNGYFTISCPVINWEDVEWKVRVRQWVLIKVYANSPMRLRKKLEKMAKYFFREMSFDFPPYDARDAEDSDRFAGYLIADHEAGYIGGLVMRQRTGWSLSWVWIHPYFRNRHIVRDVWKILDREHPNFIPLTPWSPEMISVMRRVGMTEEEVERRLKSRTDESLSKSNAESD